MWSTEFGEQDGRLCDAKDDMSMTNDDFERPADDAAIDLELRRRRAEVLALIENHQANSQPVELDQTKLGRLSRMDAMQGQAMAKETERRRCLELIKINAAIKRLEAGTYGDCLVCGDMIAKKRLTFNPAAALCILCAEKKS